MRLAILLGLLARARANYVCDMLPKNWVSTPKEVLRVDKEGVATMSAG